MQGFRSTKWVVKHIERFRRSFLWKGSDKCTGGSCLVSWDKVCCLKQNGGLGVKDLIIHNQSVNIKWLWLLTAGCGQKGEEHSLTPQRGAAWKKKEIWDCVVYIWKRRSGQVLIHEILRAPYHHYVMYEVSGESNICNNVYLSKPYVWILVYRWRGLKHRSRLSVQ